MTLANIMQLALRQLDENREDISEYDELFSSYANMGYMIALRVFVRPRETFVLTTDETGRADLGGLPVLRVVELRDERGERLRFALDADGQAIRTDRGAQTVAALCEVERPPMENAMQEPELPAYLHPALADYICYRHLSAGSLGKQSRAESFRERFYRQMHAATRQGAGSVTRLRGLYAATDARSR